MRLPKFFRGIAFVAAAASFSLALCFAILAWSEPGQTPPGGNVAAPLNTGENAQTRSGDLKIGTGLKISSDGTAFALKTDTETIQFAVGQDGNAVASSQLTAPNICFGASCATQWTTGDCPGDGNYMKGINETTGEIICSGATPGCTHKVCAANDCGPFVNGNCGGTKTCPDCTAPKVCKKDSDGKNGKCVDVACTPKTCKVGVDCGTVPNGNCGGTIKCPSCTLRKICNAGKCVCRSSCTVNDDCCSDRCRMGRCED